MDLRTVACPACETSHQFYLSADDDRHLRQCPACDRWLIAAEAADHEGVESADMRVRELDDPPTCPVDGCSASPPSEELPVHLIDVHDGSLAPGSE